MSAPLPHRPKPPQPGTTQVGSTPVDTNGEDRGQCLQAFRSEDLLRGHRAVEIRHGGLCYRLSITAMGKLILTK